MRMCAEEKLNCILVVALRVLGCVKWYYILTRLYAAIIAFVRTVGNFSFFRGFFLFWLIRVCVRVRVYTIDCVSSPINFPLILFVFFYIFFSIAFVANIENGKSIICCVWRWKPQVHKIIFFVSILLSFLCVAADFSIWLSQQTKWQKKHAMNSRECSRCRAHSHTHSHQLAITSGMNEFYSPIPPPPPFRYQTRWTEKFIESNLNQSMFFRPRTRQWCYVLTPPPSPLCTEQLYGHTVYTAAEERCIQIVHTSNGF